LLDIRHASTDADLELLISVRRRVDPDVHPQLANLRHFLDTTTTGTYLLAFVDGKAAGCGFVDGSPGHALATASFEVVPERRRRGAGDALLRAASAHARSRGFTRLRLEAKEDDDASIAFLERRGFAEAGRERHVVVDLTSLDETPTEPPPGVEIVSWAERPGLERGMYAVAREAVPDIPGEEDFAPAFEEWLAFERRPSRKPELCFAAVAGDDVIGYAAIDVFGPRAHNGLTAVRPAWRRRGVATALKRAQFAAARRAGFTELHTGSEDRNVPMRSLNAKLGYVPEPGTIVFEGPLLE
jgi:ribosomal protein S18 acetylase RimI-like enzyme